MERKEYLLFWTSQYSWLSLAAGSACVNAANYRLKIFRKKNVSALKIYSKIYSYNSIYIVLGINISSRDYLKYAAGGA